MVIQELWTSLSGFLQLQWWKHRWHKFYSCLTFNLNFWNIKYISEESLDALTNPIDFFRKIIQRRIFQVVLASSVLISSDYVVKDVGWYLYNSCHTFVYQYPLLYKYNIYQVANKLPKKDLHGNNLKSL